MKVDALYLAMADSQQSARMGSMGLFDERTASLRAFQRYSRDPHRDIRDGDGLLRWVTVKQSRVQAIVDRLAVSERQVTMLSIAAEAGCTVSTVSRTIAKLQGWALYAIEVKRGRNGGVTVHRPGWSRFWDFVYDARHRLKMLRDRARINLATSIRRGVRGSKPSPETSPVTSSFMVASIKRTFTETVVYERAMLALTDPDGEYEAVRPITRERAIEMLDWTQREPTELLAQREQALLDEAIVKGDRQMIYRINVDRQMRDLAVRGEWDKWQALADFLYPEHVHPELVR